MIFRSVPPSYHTLVQSLQSRADEDWTVALVKTRLLDEYRQRQQRSDSLSQDMRALKLDAVCDKKKICFYCKQAGHFKAECKKWLAKKSAIDSGKKKSAKSDGESQKEKQAKGMGGAVCFLAGGDGSEGWVIDSGATSHMTSDSSFLFVVAHRFRVYRYSRGR